MVSQVFALFSEGCQNVHTSLFIPRAGHFLRPLRRQRPMMTNTLQAVLCLFVQFFAPRHNAQIRFLKAQIAILRKRVPAKHIIPSPKEKAELLRLSSEFGHQVAPLLDVVTLPTYRHWINDARKGRKPKKSGRPRLVRNCEGWSSAWGRRTFSGASDASLGN